MVRPNVRPEQRGRLAEARIGSVACRFNDTLDQLTPEAAVLWMNQQHHEAAYQYGPSGLLGLDARMRMEVNLGDLPGQDHLAGGHLW